MEILFPNSGSAVVVPQITASFSSLTVLSFNDEPDRKQMYVNTLELGRIFVYTGSAYDDNYNWTKNQVTASIYDRYKPE